MDHTLAFVLLEGAMVRHYQRIEGSFLNSSSPHTVRTLDYHRQCPWLRNGACFHANFTLLALLSVLLLSSSFR
jgi:hypothetical protein